MRLSDARLRQRKTMMPYPNHRLPPWLNEDGPRRPLEQTVRRRSPPRLIPEPGPRHSMLFE